MTRFECNCAIPRPAVERPYGAYLVEDVVVVTHNSRGVSIFPHGGYVCQRCNQNGKIVCDGTERVCDVRNGFCHWHSSVVR